MLPEYKKLLEIAVKNKRENKSFFEKLKKVPGRDLDNRVHELHEKAFTKIDCLKCANCCKSTGPLLKNKDIERLSEQLRIKPSNFVSDYLRIDEDSDYVFQKMPCTFLQDDNCCSVYSARPNACRQYPHTDQSDIRSILPLTFLNSMICPAVSFVVEELKGLVMK